MLPNIEQINLADNDNAALGFLRKAVDAPSTSEVRKMIEDTILDFNLVKLEVKTPDKVIVTGEGPRHYLFNDILTLVTNNIPAALVGPAGAGKSTVVRQVAEAAGLKFYLQNSVSGTHEVAGYMDAHGRYNTSTFRTVYENGGLVLIDEVDTSDAAALKWLNTALANGYAMFPDNPDPITVHKDFRIVIAANTFGSGADRIYVGANQLDASTLDRFVFLDFRYDEKMERILSGDVKWAERVQKLRKAAADERARIVISPRATIYGAKLIKVGWDQKLVEERVIWKGMDKELKDRIEKKAA